MRSVRNWAVGSAIVGPILLGPFVAFLVVIAAEILIDVLIEAGVPVVLCLVTAGVLGWVLLRNRSLHAGRTPQWEPEEATVQAAIAAPWT
jgi:hypothetical protein